jgi:hypothetical protein
MRMLRTPNRLTLGALPFRRSDSLAPPWIPWIAVVIRRNDELLRACPRCCNGSKIMAACNQESEPRERSRCFPFGKTSSSRRVPRRRDGLLPACAAISAAQVSYKPGVVKKDAVRVL